MELMAWLMVWFLAGVMYYEIECEEDGSDVSVNERHSILIPSGHHPSMVIVSFGFAGG
jgi:hypothetical protein